jgi:hypothetical protein
LGKEYIVKKQCKCHYNKSCPGDRLLFDKSPLLFSKLPLLFSLSLIDLLRKNELLYRPPEQQSKNDCRDPFPYIEFCAQAASGILIDTDYLLPADRDSLFMLTDNNQKY